MHNYNKAYKDDQGIWTNGKYRVDEEGTNKFIAMEEAGILKSLKHLLNDKNVKDAEQTKKELSYEFMKKLHHCDSGYFC